MAARKIGSSGHKSDKLIRDALMVAIKRETTGPDGKKNTRLWLIADQLAELAAQGDLQAIKEVADRIDGKAHQTAELIIDDKRDATDWTRTELVALLDNAKNGGSGTAEADGCDGTSGQLH